MSQVNRAEQKSLLKHPFVISNSSASSVVASELVGPKPLKIWEIPHGIPDLGSKIGDMHDVDSRRNAILFVARGDLRKNFEMAIQIWLKVAQYEEIDFIVVGADPEKIYEASIRRHSKKIRKSQGSVRLLGTIPKRQLDSLYGEVRMLIVTSLYESFGLTVIESLRSGTPVISSGAGGLRDFKEIGGVFTVENNNIQEYTNFISRLSDRGEWVSASTSARNSYEANFTSQQMAISHIEAINERLRTRLR